MSYPALYNSPGGIDVISTACFFEVVAIAAIVLRLLSRRLHMDPLMFSDYAAVLGLVLTSGLFVILIICVVLGGDGQHEKDIGPEKQARLLHYYVATRPLAAAAITAVRISILHLYTEAFRNGCFRKFCHGMMAFSILFFIANIVEVFAYCHPVAYNWDKSIKGTCIGLTRSYLANSILNLILDALIFLLLMPMLWGLDARVMQKIGIFVLFSIGVVICVIDALRIVTYSRLKFQEVLTDFSHVAVPLSRWTILEPALGIVNACLPVMRPFLEKVVDLMTWLRSFRRKKRPDQELGWLNTGLIATDPINDTLDPEQTTSKPETSHGFQVSNLLKNYLSNHTLEPIKS